MDIRGDGGRPGGRLVLSGVGLRFGGLWVLDDVDVEVEAGTLHALIGPNGAGKTSVLNCISGFYCPDRGSITVDGVPLVGRRPDLVARLGVARVFQNIELFEGSDVRTNVLLGRHLLVRTGALREMVGWPGVRAEEARHRERVDDLLAVVGLDGQADRPVTSLPYGGQKLVELARALAMEPRVLLLDEPVAGMSGAEKAAVVAAVANARQQLGITVVFIEHDVELVLGLADRVTVLESGTVLATGTPAEIRADDRVIAAYIGVDAGDASTHVEVVL